MYSKADTSSIRQGPGVFCQYVMDYQEPALGIVSPGGANEHEDRILQVIQELFEPARLCRRKPRRSK
jgi:hypothetical protein